MTKLNKIIENKTTEPIGNVKCYHMTSLDRLESIHKHGLTPRNEKNSKLVNDDKIKVFFSEGFEGAIALFVDFEIVYSQIKNKQMKLNDEDLNNRIIHSKCLRDYLGEGVYLCFNLDNTKNERNFENGCTSEVIEPKRLNVLLLRNVNSNKITYSRFDIINYMMAWTEPENIKYYGVHYSDSPNFEVATKRIQEKVINYYANNKYLIEKYHQNEYELLEITLDKFMKTYI